MESTSVPTPDTSARPSASAAEPPKEKPAITGWLFKAGATEADAQRRWFELRGTSLSYFQTPEDTTARRTLEIAGAVISKAGVGPTGRSKIQIRASSSTSSNPRIYNIEAESAIECDYWVEAMTIAVNTAAAAPPPVAAGA
eukprot:4116750-Prymnesium_polylepis.1